MFKTEEIFSGVHVYNEFRNLSWLDLNSVTVQKTVTEFTLVTESSREDLFKKHSIYLGIHDNGIEQIVDGDDYSAAHMRSFVAAGQSCE